MATKRIRELQNIPTTSLNELICGTKLFKAAHLNSGGSLPKATAVVLTTSIARKGVAIGLRLLKFISCS